jgi:hypothetical protein
MPENMMRHGFFKGVVPNMELHDAAWEGVQLRKPEDREAALNGILRMLESIFDVAYIVGLWRKGLPSQLVWKSIRPAKPSPKSRASSWPWLSTDAHRATMIRKTVKGTFLEVTCTKLQTIGITRADESALSPLHQTSLG